MLDQIFAIEGTLTLNVAIADTITIGVGGHGLAIAYGDKIIFTSNGKVLEESDDDLTPRRQKLLRILSSIVIIKLLLFFRVSYTSGKDQRHHKL